MNENGIFDCFETEFGNRLALIVHSLEVCKSKGRKEKQMRGHDERSKEYK